MGLRSWIRSKDLSTRAIDSFQDQPGLTDQLLEVQGLRSRPWRAVGVNEALAVPAIGRSVALLASLAGSLPMRSYYDGRLEDPTPRIIARPDPFMSYRDFVFGAVWNMASRGAAVLYAAGVDGDGEPTTILNLPRSECQIEWDDRRIERIVKWRGRQLSTARVRIIRLYPDPEQLAGAGPLQLTGAAVSAAVEADEWAARYFAESGVTATHLHSQTKLQDAEAEAIRRRWVDNKSSVKVTSGGVMTAAPLGVNPKDSQLMDARMFSRGEASVIFGIPGKLLEYVQAGSSLTYQNVGDLMTELVRATLAPLYLTPIEDAMTDLVVRRRTVRFDLDELQRADPKTRYEIHGMAITNGIYDAAYARVLEQIDPGSLETAPQAGPGPVPSIPDDSGPGARSIV